MQPLQEDVTIGQREALSAGDILQANLLYNCPSRCTVKERNLESPFMIHGHALPTASRNNIGLFEDQAIVPIGIAELLSLFLSSQILYRQQIRTV